MQSDQSSLSTLWTSKDPQLLTAASYIPDQAAGMCRLVRVFAYMQIPQTAAPRINAVDDFKGYRNMHILQRYTSTILRYPPPTPSKFYNYITYRRLKSACASAQSDQRLYCHSSFLLPENLDLTAQMGRPILSLRWA